GIGQRCRLTAGLFDFLPLRLFDPAVHLFPLAPEFHAVGPVLYGSEGLAGPAWGLSELDGEALAVEGGAESDDVGARCAGFHEEAVEPGAGFFASGGRADVAVVFQVVTNDERGAELTTAASADALAGAEGFDHDAVV